MKRRFSLYKDDIIIIAKALKKILKTCQCNYTTLDQCYDCKNIKEVFDKINETASKASRKKL